MFAAATPICLCCACCATGASVCLGPILAGGVTTSLTG